MSCSQRKIEANRRNAQQSTGPRTAEGKAAASRNATTHGLTAATSPVALDESPEEYEAFAAALRADLRPRGAMQAVIVERIVHLSWKLKRLPAVEAEAIKQLAPRAGGGERVPATAARAVARDAGYAGSGVLARLQTYESRIERSLRACLKELAEQRKLQAEDPPAQNEPTDVEPQPPSSCTAERMKDDGGRMNAEVAVQNEPTDLSRPAALHPSSFSLRPSASPSPRPTPCVQGEGGAGGPTARGVVKHPHGPQI
jgi:hypothetical protein